MRLVITIALTFFFISLFCQIKRDYFWILGYDGHPDVGAGEGTLINFNGGETSFEFLEKDMEMASDNASICDAEGNLLFYTNGCYIADKNHQPMQNGEGLNPGNIHDIFCENGYPTIQGSIILPHQGNPDLYYLLHLRRHSMGLFSDYLYYTLVDMEQNNGLGVVTEKNIPVVQDSLWPGYLTAVKHANNQDWWIVAPRHYSNKYYKILLSQDSIEVNDEQEIGPELTSGALGQAVFSPDGTKYIFYNRGQNLLIFNFDRSTGELSNFQQIPVADTIYFGGVAVSSNSRFLYVSNAIYLYQYDLQASDIQASKVVIDTFDGFNSPFSANFYLMQLAPDCRIYMSTGNGTDRLHVINYPNRKGKDCDFQQHAIQLPSYNFHTIPNFPNYRLGTPYPVCDSSIVLVTASVPVLPPLWEVEVWPNPAREEIHLSFEMAGVKEATFSLCDLTGRKIKEWKIQPGTTEQTFSLQGIADGMYFWNVTAEGRRVQAGKLIKL